MKKHFQLAPFITISREAGSGGKLVAQKLAKKLHFSFYDEELIDLVAKTAKKRKAAIAKLDEKQRTFLDDIVHRLLNPEYISTQTYVKSLCQAINVLSWKGKVVILGRGANFFTDREKGLHVRVSAPYLTRVKQTIKYEKQTEKRARFRVKKLDNARKEFVRQFFNKDPFNTNYYDIVVNTEVLAIDQAVEVIIEAFKQKFNL